MIEVNSLWIGDRFSRLEYLAVVSHFKFGHKFHLWTYRPVANVPIDVILKDANEILPESEIFAYQVGKGRGSFSAFSNFFRYKLLLERGGWWVDADVVALRPFAFPSQYVIATERDKSGRERSTTCVIRCPLGSELMRFCWQRCQIVDKQSLMWGAVGPDLLGEAVEFMGLNQYKVASQTFCPVDWFNIEALFEQGDVSGSHAVHLWNEMWRRKGIDKDKAFGTETLYERLAASDSRSYSTLRWDQRGHCIGYL